MTAEMLERHNVNPRTFRAASRALRVKFGLRWKETNATSHAALLAEDDTPQDDDLEDIADTVA